MKRVFAFIVAFGFTVNAFGLPLLNTSKYQIDFTAKGTAAIVSFKGFASNSITVFDVESPNRIVIDIPVTDIALPKGTKAIKSNCIKAVRFGSHKDKTRLVLDRTNSECIHSEKTEGRSFSISVTTLFDSHPEEPAEAPANETTDTPNSVTTATQTPKPTETAKPTESAKPTETLKPTLTTLPTNTPHNTPITAPRETAAPKSTPEPTAPIVEITPSTAEPTVVPESTQAAVQIITPSEGKVLKEILFSHEDEQAVVKLSLSERSNFKLTRENSREYRISISDCKALQAGLTLPQFPPNDIVGFTLVKATQSEGKLDILIGVDDGMKATAVNKDSMIIVRAEPTGF